MPPSAASSDAGGSQRGGPGSSVALSRQLNQQITQAANLQELVHVVVVNFNRMNAVNFCTAYHRIARHVQDQRTPPDQWPPAQQEQLGRLLTELNQALMDRLREVQAHNLGLTLWSISKTYRLPQEYSDQLWASLQVEVTHRLSTVSHSQYMTDKHYSFGPQSLSNIIYSAASMGLKADYDLLHAVGRAVAWEIAEFKPQGLANILWALGKLGVKVTHEIRQMVEALTEEMLEQLTRSRHKGNFAPQNISNTLHGLVNIGIAPQPELLSALVRCADSQLRQFGPQELTNTAWALSQMHRQGVPFTPDVDALLDRIPDELSLLFADRSWRSRVKPQTISNLANAYAHLGRVPQLLMRDLVREALPMLQQFKPQELSNLLWSIATMGYYPGASVVEAITRAAGAAADRMKPQEIANTVWAWATLRFFPGAALLDRMLAQAEAQLDRFKSQELGNLCWAVAKLAYMPAAALVRAALPVVAAWRAPSVQDCGNVLWAFTVLDILTPEVMQLLAGKLLSLSRESFTQEAYIQLYQAKMSLSQQVHAIAQYIPPELLAQAETEWRQQSSVIKVSLTHRDVAAVMRELRIECEVEKKIEDGLISVDIALRNEMVAVEVDGSAHWTQNEPYAPLGRTIWRWRILASRGWRVVSVPYYRWARLESLAAKKQYLYQLLQCVSVWECISLNPHVRDAPFCPPANLAHLTPDEVFQLAADGVAPSSLLPSTHSSGPTASPATPLLAGLGPASGGSSLGFSPAAASFEPGTGLARPSSASALLPLPVTLGTGGLGQLPGSGPTAAPLSPAPGVASGGYGRLPDSIYGSESPTSSGGASSLSLGGPGRLGGGGASGSGGRLNVGAQPFTLGSGGGSNGVSPAVGGQLRPPSASASPLSVSSFGGMGGGGSSLAASAPAFSPRPPTSDLPSMRSSPALMRGSALSSLASSAAASPMIPPFSAGALRSLQASHHHQPLGQHLPPPAFPPPRQQQQPAPRPLLRHDSSPAPVPGLLSAGQGSEPGGTASTSAALPPGVDADSDDEVGDLRSYFGSVIGLSPACGAPLEPAGPLSVEEAQRKLALLSADVAVADVAPALLEGWDAELAAELLCQLDSPTTAARALQLFEWLHGLAPDSPHAHLCTPDTYAVMIGLYGRWRKPKAAVRLFAELKDRGEDTPEVHSALVQAFCWSGQPDVALDAYRHLLSQGLPPTPTAFRAVLDVHMGRGAWEEADAVLGDMAKGGSTALDAELLNSVIERACAAGAPGAAQSAYNHLCHAGVAPTPATYAALLAALLRQHPPAEVAELAVGLAQQAAAAPGGVAAVMHAVLAACAMHGWCDLSLLLLEALEAAGGTPTVELIDGALAACAAGGAGAEARRAFAQLEQHDLQPSPASHLHLAQALVAAGQWGEVAKEYEALLASGAQPSEALSSLAVDALWGTGLAWAQAKALELFDQAMSAGWLLPAEATSARGLLKLDLRAQHAGTAELRMHRWLLDLRRSIGNTSTPCVLDTTKRICVVSHGGGVAGDSAGGAGAGGTGAAPGGSSEAAAAAALAVRLKGELGASLVQHQAPFRVAQEDGRAQRLESSTFMVKKWLFSEAFDSWDRVFSGRAALEATGASAGDMEARLLCEEQLAAEAAQTYALIRDYETSHALDGGALRLAGYPERRRELVQAAHQLAAGLGLGATAQLWHAAVVLLDRCAAAGYKPALDAALAAACVALAAAREGIPADVAQLSAQLNREMTLHVMGVEPEAALQGEMAAAAAALRGDTACISAVHCWKVFADRMQVNVEDVTQTEALLGDSFPRLHDMLAAELSLQYAPSVQAAAAVFMARKARGAAPFWPTVLQQLTGYEEGAHPEFAEALRELQHTSHGSTVSQAVFA